MILNQLSLTKAVWGEKVNKMRATYRAPVDPTDVDYLAAVKGKT